MTLPGVLRTNHRSGRLEFVALHLICVFVAIMLLHMVSLIDSDQPGLLFYGALLAVSLFSLLNAWVLLAVYLRRLRDIGLHPLWLLVVLLTPLFDSHPRLSLPALLVNVVFAIALAVTPGAPE